MKAQEKLVRGAAAMGDPVALMPTAAARAAAPPAAQAAAAAAAAAAAEAAPPPLSAADAAADAASEILARAARKDADKLSLDDALRDPALFNGLRKMLHDEKGAPEEEAAVLASKLLLLREAVAKGGDVPATLAEDVRALSAAPGMGLSSSVAAVADGAGGAAALLAALEPALSKVRDGLTPSLERLRAEIARDGTTPSVPRSMNTAGGKARKRVVVAGAGWCGAMAAYRLDKIPELHVTLLDTKEYMANTPNVLRLMCVAGEEFDSLFHASHIAHTDYVKNGDVVIGTLAAVRQDHILLGAKVGVAARALPYDYLVIATGTSYQSDIKTDGTSIEHRRRSLILERQRIADAPAAVVVGGGLVGTELALDIATYFPGKKVEWLSGNQKLLSRIKGAHEVCTEVVDREAQKGTLQLSLGERGIAVDDDGSISTDRGNKTTAGARAFWCTGYRPNNAFMRDPRTNGAVGGCLDEEGFIAALPTHQLAHPDLKHVFAGGDICCKARFGGGERMAAVAHTHAMVICENIERLSGVKEGPLQAAHIGIPIAEAAKGGEHMKTDNEAVILSLGKTDTLFYSKQPMMKSFFQKPEETEAKWGPIESAPNGWIELGDMSFLKFGMVNDMVSGLFREGKDDWWAQFDGPRLHDA